ncbi:MAG TPA: GNAT family N-acetyltransferase [Armatimonadota bacterium]
MEIRPYNADSEEGEALRLWEAALGEVWPIARAAFRLRTNDPRCAAPGNSLGAWSRDRMVGFVSAQCPAAGDASGRPAGILVLLVDPEHRRKGLGRRLHDAALAWLWERGARCASLGVAGYTYFWPGVSTSLPGAWEFARALGWEETGRTFDLVADLDESRTPDWVCQRPLEHGVIVAPASAADAVAILAFEARHFPYWLAYYEERARHGPWSDVFVAKAPDGELVGTSYVVDARREWERDDLTPWCGRLDPSLGGVGPLGVAEDWQGRGIGLALAAAVTDELRHRGLRQSFVGYTWLSEWYGRLGYLMWEEYRQSTREL